MVPLKIANTTAPTQVRKLAIAPLRSAVPTQVFTLPSEPKKPDTDPLHYTWLIYGREKIGKTTLMSSFPEAMFLSTEPGTKGLSIYEFNSENGGVTDWKILRAAVDLLEKNPGKFKTIVIDTADRAYDMCLDYVCAEWGIEYPGSDSGGEQDFGKSWRAVKQEFQEIVYRIIHSGRGVCFTSHAKEQDIKLKDGTRYTRVFPTMGAQSRAIIEALVDFFFFADYIKDTDGNTRRILICQGDDTIWAGARKGVCSTFPQFIPIEEKNGYETIKAAFLGEYPGLDARTLKVAQTSTKTGAAFIRKVAAKTVMQNIQYKND